MAASNATSVQPLLTADGTPLKTSLQRSLRRSKLRAVALVLPPLLFLIGLFVLPIGNLLTRSTDDTLINHQLPLTFAMLDQWDRQQLPDESLFEAIFLDLTTLNKYLIKDNFANAVDPDDPAWMIQIPKKGPYRDAMIEIAPYWKDPKTWLPIYEIAVDGANATGTEREIKYKQKRRQFDICSMLTPLTNAACSKLYKALNNWDGRSEPDEPLFQALYKDLASANKFLLGKSSTRMNYEKPGFKSLIKKSSRKLKKSE